MYALGERGEGGAFRYVMDFFGPGDAVGGRAPVHGHHWTKDPAFAQRFANKRAAHEYLVRLAQVMPHARLDIVELPEAPFVAPTE